MEIAPVASAPQRQFSTVYSILIGCSRRLSFAMGFRSIFEPNLVIGQLTHDFDTNVR